MSYSVICNWEEVQRRFFLFLKVHGLFNSTAANHFDDVADTFTHKSSEKTGLLAPKENSQIKF